MYNVPLEHVHRTIPRHMEESPYMQKSIREATLLKAAEKMIEEGLWHYSLLIVDDGSPIINFHGDVVECITIEEVPNPNA